MQWNGTLNDDAFLELCLRTNTTVSVSMAGPVDVNDAFRIAFNAEGTYQRVAAGIDRIRQHPQGDQIFTGALCVINPQSNPRRGYDFFKSLGVPSVDFLFKDGNYVKLRQCKI